MTSPQKNKMVENDLNEEYEDLNPAVDLNEDIEQITYFFYFLFLTPGQNYAKYIFYLEPF